MNVTQLSLTCIHSFLTTPPWHQISQTLPPPISALMPWENSDHVHSPSAAVLCPQLTSSSRVSSGQFKLISPIDETCLSLSIYLLLHSHPQPSTSHLWTLRQFVLLGRENHLCFPLPTDHRWSPSQLTISLSLSLNLSLLSPLSVSLSLYLQFVNL